MLEEVGTQESGKWKGFVEVTVRSDVRVKYVFGEDRNGGVNMQMI